MTVVRRLVLALVVGSLVALAAVGVAWSQLGTGDRSAADRTARDAGRTGVVPGATTDPSTATPSATPRDEPSSDAPSDVPTEEPSQESPEPTDDPSSPDPTPSETATPDEPELVAGPALLAPGDSGDEVRALQARLRQIDWFNQDVTGTYGDVTKAAVEGFQAKREIPVTGEVDRRTMDRLEAMTTEPTADELANRIGGNVPGRMDARCRTGRVLCIDKTSRTLRWVVDGQTEVTLDVRFGSEETPTREGVFRVDRKAAEHVSSIYGSPMPYSMFFSRGQAVHYSSDFAARGYDGASHGCVNVRDKAALASLFGQVRVGDTVVVYRS